MNDPASRPWRLYLLLVLVMFIWALNFIATKVALKEIPGALLSGFRLTLAAIFLIPVFRWAKKKDGKTWDFADGWRMALLGSMTIYLASGFDFSKVSLAAWLGVLYMAMFSSVPSSLFYYYVLGQLPASRVSSFSYLQPLRATTLDVTVLGAPMSSALVGGGALILGGVFLTERS